MALPTSSDLVQKFVRDENGFLKATFTDPNTGSVVPAENLQQYYEGTYSPELYSDGLPQAPVAPSLGGLSTNQVNSVARPVPASSNYEELLNRGSGTQHATEGDTSPRMQSNNFGYLNDPPGMGLASTALGMVNPALGLAAKGVGGLINNNNAAAVSSARQSIGLKPLSGLAMASKTFSGTQNGKVADVSIGDNKYNVGLEALDSEGRTTLTPDEARKRSGVLGQPITEESQSATGGLLGTAAKAAAGAMLPGSVKLGLGVASAATKKAPEGFKDQGIAGNLMNAGRQKLGLSPKLQTNDPRPATVSPLSLGPTTPKTPQTSSVTSQGPKSSVPSFDSLSANSSAATSSLGVTRNLQDNSSGLAGVTTSGRFGKISGFNRSNLDPSINKALDAVAAVAPGLGINSGYRSPEGNAKAGGAKASQHIQGKAVDINIGGLTDQQKTRVLDAAVQNGVKGVGIYPGGRVLHIDTRQNFATWGPAAKDKYAGVSIDQQPAWSRNVLTATRDAGIYSPGPQVGPVPMSRETAKSLAAKEQQAKAQQSVAENSSVSAQAGKNLSFNDQKADKAATSAAQAKASGLASKKSESTKTDTASSSTSGSKSSTSSSSSNKGSGSSTSSSGVGSKSSSTASSSSGSKSTSSNSSSKSASNDSKGSGSSSSKSGSSKSGGIGRA